MKNVLCFHSAVILVWDNLGPAVWGIFALNKKKKKCFMNRHEDADTCSSQWPLILQNLQNKYNMHDMAVGFYQSSL